jgi:uncharacterized protein YggE
MDQTVQLKKWSWYVGIAFGVCASILALTFAYGQVKAWSHPASQGATITVSGEGEVQTVPDIAEITFTTREVAKTVKEARDAVEKKVAPTVTAIKKLGVNEKDIKTTSYTTYPKYEYHQIYCIKAPCESSKQELVGYEVTQTTQVKVRDTEKVGTVISLIAEAGVTETSGPNFTIDKLDDVIAQAKQKAIENAREKAKTTARALGVSLGRIVGYSDGGSGYPVPMYARAYDATAGAKMANESVSIEQGENSTKVTVSITYELD